MSLSTPRIIDTPSAIIRVPAPAPAELRDAHQPPESHEPQEIAERMGRQQKLWRPLVRFGEPRFAVRLVAGSGWEAWLLSWLPGQSTRLHDHGGSAGAFTVVDGELDESVLVPRASANGGKPRLELATRRYRTGEIRAFGPDHVHDVAARAGVPAVSLHVYRPRLSAMTRYALDPDGDLTVLSRERAGVDW
jgi:hypothetical protein